MLPVELTVMFVFDPAEIGDAGSVVHPLAAARVWLFVVLLLKMAVSVAA
jgi:hypothetical protein